MSYVPVLHTKAADAQLACGLMHLGLAAADVDVGFNLRVLAKAI